MPYVSTLDLALFILLGIAAFAGYRKGFVLELVSTFSYLIGIVSAFILLDLSLTFLQPIFGKSWWLPRLTFLVIAISVGFGLRMFALYIRSTMKGTLIGTSDKWLGAGLGTLKMAFILSIVLWFVNLLGLELNKRILVNKDDQPLGSKLILYPYISPLAPATATFVGKLLPPVDSLSRSIKTVFDQK
jgi:membrane protein required for colicin V production